MKKTSAIRKVVLGIDISKPYFDIVVLKELDCAELVYSAVARFDNMPTGFAQLLKWLKKQEATGGHACMEATGRYGDALALFLHTHRIVVSVVNPKVIHDYALMRMQRNKSDPIDATQIARFCLKETPLSWSPASPQIQCLQALLKCLADRKGERQREINRLKSIIPCPQVIAFTQSNIEHLDAQIKQITAAIKSLVAATPVFASRSKLLVSIPGIGALTAWWLVSFDLPGFENAAAAVAMAGLNPSQRQSGTSVRLQTRLSKRGHADIRKALYMPAVSALTHNPFVAALAARLAAKSRHNLSIIAAAMHKLIRIAFGVLKSNKPFDPSFHPYLTKAH